uniref:WGS project CBMI000000000 data, contig CS3069_c002557 n=1 Tax=Fusarium clavum TaxID=2594811 RepID=A0A090MCZ8_9HYPO|nr:unnamed protein product [Fusarium clavum]
MGRFKSQLGDLAVTLQNSSHQTKTHALLASSSCPQDLGSPPMLVQSSKVITDVVQRQLDPLI